MTHTISKNILHQMGADTVRRMIACVYGPLGPSELWALIDTFRAQVPDPTDREGIVAAVLADEAHYRPELADVSIWEFEEAVKEAMA